MWIDQHAVHAKFHDNWSTVSKLTTKTRDPQIPQKSWRQKGDMKQGLTFLTGCCLPYCVCCMFSWLVYFDVSVKCLVCIVVRWIVYMVVAVLCILWSSYVYLLY
jgi:hypothetical protein